MNRHARMTQILIQAQTAARTAPAPAAFKMKFNPGFEFGREPNRQADQTMNLDPLEEQTDVGDAVLTGTIPAILCLNDMGQWLKHLLGDPATTGVGPYEHEYTLDLSVASRFLMELGYTDVDKYPRWLDCIVNSLSYSIKEAEQNISLGIMGGTQISPIGGAVFDAAPTIYAKDRACSRGGEVYDVDGASTLGQIIEASLNLSKDYQGQLIADGLEGYSDYLVGQPSLGGTLRFIYDDGTNLFDHGHANTAKPLTLISMNAAGDASLEWTIPAAEFSEPKHRMETSAGIIATVDWKAIKHATDPVTVVLTNGIVSY